MNNLSTGIIFKIIIWAGSCVAMYYGMQMSGWIGDETPLAQGLFFIGLLHTALTVFEVKFLGVVIFRGISDLFVHTAGIIMIIAGIVMMVA